MPVFGEGMQGFVGEIAPVIGGTRTGLAPWHRARGDCSDGWGSTISFMTIAKITRDSKTISQWSVLFLSISVLGVSFRFFFYFWELLLLLLLYSCLYMGFFGKFNDNNWECFSFTWSKYHHTLKQSNMYGVICFSSFWIWEWVWGRKY